MDVVDVVVVVAGTGGGLGLVLVVADESAVARAVRSGSLPFDWGW